MFYLIPPLRKTKRGVWTDDEIIQIEYSQCKNAMQAQTLFADIQNFFHFFILCSIFKVWSYFFFFFFKIPVTYVTDFHNPFLRV